MAASPDQNAQPTIFVSMASYRDPECHCTIRDLFAKAKYPERVHVGICWQFISPQDDYMFQLLDRADQVRCIGFDARGSLGACWAKSEAQRLWGAEDYVLHIDSHMRFAAEWDTRFVEILSICPSPKPVLSTYPAPYEPPDKLFPSTPHLVAREFKGDTGILHLHGEMREMDCPKRGGFISGNFYFARADFLAEVPYDPEIYFYGEEVAMSVRAWSRGWDVFTPHACLIYHRYGPSPVPRHWDDHPEWWKLEQVSIHRVKQLLETPSGASSDQFGLGEERTVADFEAFTGISFRDRALSERALRGSFVAL